MSVGDVLVVADIDRERLRALLAGFDLELIDVAAGQGIPGSYWGDPEAGVIAHRVYVRPDTPVHSVLHEASHLIILEPERRATVHTDASDSQIEEDATCLLQILLADRLADVGRERLMDDMDRWGYTFRLGSARAWFDEDADDARGWLAARGLPGDWSWHPAPALAATAIAD